MPLACLGPETITATLPSQPRLHEMIDTATIAVVGLGYVGLPLAVEFAKKYATIGFDLSTAKIAAYQSGVDPTGEVSPDALKAVKRLRFTTDATELRRADFIIV